jgi:hypothetical protein
VQALPPKLAHLRSRLSAARRPSGVDRSEGGGPRGRSSPSPSSAEPKSRRPRLPKARWILAVGGLAALSVAVSAWLHGGRFGVSKPATQQPVKDVRSGAQAPALNRAAGPHTQAAQAAESQT